MITVEKYMKSWLVTYEHDSEFQNLSETNTRVAHNIEEVKQAVGELLLKEQKGE